MKSESVYDQTAIDASREMGYLEGRYWPDAWDGHAAPGGPWFRYYDSQSIAENEAWRRGWRAGIEDKIKGGYRNPCGTPDDNRKYHQ